MAKKHRLRIESRTIFPAVLATGEKRVDILS